MNAVLEYVSIDNLTLLWTGKTYSAIKKMIQRGKIKDVKWLTKREAINEGLQWKEGGGGGKDGKRPFININDPAIPSEVKARYLKTDSEVTVGDIRPSLQLQGQGPASLAPALLNQNQNIPMSAGNEALASSFRSGSAEHSSIYFSTQGQEITELSLAPTFFPEKAKVIGKARLDLVKAWQDYRKESPLKKGKADNGFLSGYNSGIMFPTLFESLNKVSRQTLYNWHSTLNGTQDWTKLIPQYYDRGAKGPGLNEYEEKLFMSLLLRPNKIKIGTACRLVKYALKKNGHPTHKSERTFERFAKKFEKEHYDIWILMREGQKALRDKVEPFIKRDPSVLDVGDVLVADGHRLNFRVINPFTGKPCRATLIGYVDWKSYDLAGYEIMVEENTQSIAAALRNSILRLGRIPKVAYQDNGKAFKSRFFTEDISLEECGFYGLFGRLGILPVFATPYNARAKIIERWFKEFSDSFERLVPSFTGSNINDKPAWMLRNEKFHKALHNEYIPTIEEAKGMIEEWFKFSRSQPCPHVKGKTIGEVFNEGRGTGANVNELDDLMMATEIKNIRRNGIRFLNADYYNESLHGMRDEVLIKYSLFDLSQIKVYEMSGQFLCKAEREEPIHPMASALGDVKDITELKYKISRQKNLKNQTVRLAREHLKVNGNVPQLPWQSIAENTPKVIEKLSAENISLPEEERHIPEEMLNRTSDHMTIEENKSMEGERRPIFESSWQRYEYLLEQSEISDDERQWIDEYIKSSEYMSIYGKDGDSNLGFYATSWEKYQGILNQPYKESDDWRWIRKYEDGEIHPGEYEAGCRARDLKKAAGGNE